MRRFLFNLLLFVALLTALDFAVGFVSKYLVSHAIGGSTQNNYYIAESMTCDVLIMGSSRATHHYIPSIIKDSTSLSCYNCGEEGNGSILAYGRFKMAVERYNPKIIIYEVTPEYDYFKDEDNSKYLKYLKPYYSKRYVKKLFCEFGNDFDNIKLKCKMYQNNGLFLTQLIDNFIKRDNCNGYSPLYGELKLENDLSRKRIKGEIDMEKVGLLEDMIDECKSRGICMIFVISPRYKTVNDAGYYDYAKTLANNNNISVYDYSRITDINDNPYFFNDPLHMNNNGAKYYTQHYVCDLIKNETVKL